MRCRRQDSNLLHADYESAPFTNRATPAWDRIVAAARGLSGPVMRLSRVGPMSDLDSAVRAVVRDCLGVAEGEEVLVICNPATRGLGERLREEAAGCGADAVLALMD